MSWTLIGRSKVADTPEPSALAGDAAFTATRSTSRGACPDSAPWPALDGHHDPVTSDRGSPPLNPQIPPQCRTKPQPRFALRRRCGPTVHNVRSEPTHAAIGARNVGRILDGILTTHVHRRLALMGLDGTSSILFILLAPLCPLDDAPPTGRLSGASRRQRLFVRRGVPMTRAGHIAMTRPHASAPRLLVASPSGAALASPAGCSPPLLDLE
jgi:hypothetical protein